MLVHYSSHHFLPFPIKPESLFSSACLAWSICTDYLSQIRKQVDYSGESTSQCQAEEAAPTQDVSTQGPLGAFLHVHNLLRPCMTPTWMSISLRQLPVLGPCTCPDNLTCVPAFCLCLNSEPCPTPCTECALTDQHSPGGFQGRMRKMRAVSPDTMAYFSFYTLNSLLQNVTSQTKVGLNCSNNPSGRMDSRVV